MNIELSPKKITRMLACVALFLTLASLTGHFSKFFLGRTFGLLRLFDLDAEANVTTWYQSFTLLLCSLLLAVTAFVRKVSGGRYIGQWKALAVIFLCLSLDELVRIHEMSIAPVRTALHAGGLFYFAWVIPGLVFVIIFVLAYLKFLTHLPAEVRRLFILAGMVYIGGALGVEMLGGRYSSLHGEENVPYVLITTVEEVFEMLGVLIFIYVLLSFLKSHLKSDTFRLFDFLSEPPTQDTPPGTHAEV